MADSLVTSWGEGSCVIEKGARSLRIEFPEREKFLARVTFSGKEYPIPDLLRPVLTGMPVVDIGSHIGTTLAYWELELEPSVMYAYEPDVRSLKYLKKNIEPFAERVRLREAAVAAKPGRTPLYTAAALCLSSIVKRPWNTDDPPIEVEAIGASEVLASIQGPIGVLKIDAEEAEVDILQEMWQGLRRVRVVFVEHHGEDLRRQVDDILADAGFLMFHAHNEWTRGVGAYVHRDYARHLYGEQPEAVPQVVEDAAKPIKEVIDEITEAHYGPPPTRVARLRCYASTAPPPIKPVKLMLAMFPGGTAGVPHGTQRQEIISWLMRTHRTILTDPRIDDDILEFSRANTPITMTRNECIEVAKREKADFVVMVDADMSPDLYWPGNYHREYADPTAKKFFESSFEFAYRMRAGGQPCVIGAPYCGPPPHENVYVFHWTTLENDRPKDEPDMILNQYPREHAANMCGIQEVAALPTGLILIDMQAIAHLDPPYFYYEWEDNTESKKASTEDVTFTRNLSLNGVPQYCNWDAWAGHFKLKCVGRPKVLSAKSLNVRFRARVLREYNIQGPDEKLVFIGNGKGKKGKPGGDKPKDDRGRIAAGNADPVDVSEPAPVG